LGYLEAQPFPNVWFLYIMYILKYW